MEELIVAIASLLLRSNGTKAGLIFYSIINFNVWLTIIHDLFELDTKLSPFQSRWNKISERIRRIKDQRDQLAHHSVQTRDDEIHPSAVRPSTFDSRRKSLKQEPMSVLETRDFANAVLDISESLQELIQAMIGALEASREKPD